MWRTPCPTEDRPWRWRLIRWTLSGLGLSGKADVAAPVQSAGMPDPVGATAWDCGKDGGMPLEVRTTSTHPFLPRWGLNSGLFSKDRIWAFLGGPVVRTLFFHC